MSLVCDAIINLIGPNVEAGSRVEVLGFRVWGLGFGAEGLGFGVVGLEFKATGGLLTRGVPLLGFPKQAGFRVLGFRV